MKNVARQILLCGILLCLAQVWLPQYFLTGDGPSHLYNAQILHDLWIGKNATFYHSFYWLSYQPNPNWLCTLALALLLFIVKGMIAEKIFLTFYILAFAGGFYLLLKKISANPYWPLTLLLFVFPHVLAKGFYNYSFSIAFYFWMVWSWLLFLEQRNIKNGLLFFVFVFLLFFTHLLSFVFGAFTCASLLLSYALAEEQRFLKAVTGKFFLRYAALLVLFLSPFIVLSRWFTQKEGGLHLQLMPHPYRLIELAEGKYLINISHTEDMFAQVAAVVLLFLIVLIFSGSRRKWVIGKHDGFILSFIFVLFVYLFFPESFMGKLILISMRVQPFVFITGCCCIACRLPADIAKNRYLITLLCFLVSGIACILYLIHINGGAISRSTALGAHIIVSASAFAMFFLLASGYLLHRSFSNLRMAGAWVIFSCFAGLFFARISCMMEVSAGAADYLSVINYIQPGKVVLPLDFAPSDTDGHGNAIADRNFLFVHAAQYLGTEKPLIFLDNYEANMGYFPINWIEKRDPYLYFNTYGGIEAVPPFADISSYESAGGMHVDYIIMWCYNPAFLQDGHFAQLYAEIQGGYHKIYTSPKGKTEVYEINAIKKNPPKQ